MNAERGWWHDLPLPNLPGGISPRRPGTLPPTELQAKINLAKAMIEDARAELTADEYGVFATIVAGALERQRRA